MAERRISKTVAKFHQQITSMDDALQANSTNGGCVGLTNADCLGVLAADATGWHSRRLLWDGSGGLYPRYNNPSTKPLIDGENGDVAVFIREFQAFAERPLNAIANSANCTSELATIFNVVPNALRANPTRPTAVITEDCFPSVNALGGGSMQFTVRTALDSGRPSKPDGADGVQLAYKIGATPPSGPVPPNDAPGQPSPDLCPIKEVFTKSQFVVHLGAGNATQKLYVFARWYNTKHPELSGQWSPMVEAPIA